MPFGVATATFTGQMLSSGGHWTGLPFIIMAAAMYAIMGMVMYVLLLIPNALVLTFIFHLLPNKVVTSFLLVADCALAGWLIYGIWPGVLKSPGELYWAGSGLLLIAIALYREPRSDDSPPPLPR